MPETAVLDYKVYKEKKARNPLYLPGLRVLPMRFLTGFMLFLTG